MRSYATLPTLMRYAISLRYSYLRSGERCSSSRNSVSDIAQPLLGQFHDDSADTGLVAIENTCLFSICMKLAELCGRCPSPYIFSFFLCSTHYILSLTKRQMIECKFLSISHRKLVLCLGAILQH